MLDPSRLGMKEQIACLARELRLRTQVYPRLVSSRRMTADDARREIVLMQTCLKTMQRLHNGELPEQQSLW